MAPCIDGPSQTRVAVHDSTHKGIIEASYARERRECAKGRKFNVTETTELPLEVSGDKDRRGFQCLAIPEGDALCTCNAGC